MNDRFPVVTPEGWLPKGEAFARVDGHPVSIWQGIPGERSQINIYRKGQNRHSARWESSHQPHPDRVEPACSRYSRCGGCALMHLSPDGQSKAWFDMLRYELRTVELRDVQVSRVVPSPDGRTDFRHAWARSVEIVTTSCPYRSASWRHPRFARSCRRSPTTPLGWK